MPVDPRLVLLYADDNFGRLIALLVLALVSWIGSLIKKHLDKKAQASASQRTEDEAEEAVLEEVDDSEPSPLGPFAPPRPVPPFVVTARPARPPQRQALPSPLGLPAHHPSTVVIAPSPTPRLAVSEVPLIHTVRVTGEVQPIARVDARSSLAASAGSLVRRIDSAEQTTRTAPASVRGPVEVFAALRRLQAGDAALIRQAIVLREVLGPPAALRGRGLGFSFADDSAS